ncbi:MAG: hypothetical protein AAF799_09075 [Myxococcota bacterium]
MPQIHDLRGLFLSRAWTLAEHRPASIAASRARLTVAGALGLLLAGCPSDDGMVIADAGGETEGSGETDDAVTDDGMAEAGTPMATTDAATGTGGEEETEGVDESSGDESTTDDVDPSCGDGILDDGEECDDHGESALCNADCTVSSCGDGTVNILAGEECDDEGESSGCNDDCTEAMCGDGILNASAGEDCDGDGESAECNADCTPTQCGDGIINETAGEECDDSNMEDLDFCSSTCLAAPSPVLDADHVFDTDTGELDGVPQFWDAATSTWFLNGLEIQETGVLTVVGSNSLTIVADGPVLVAGTIDGSGQDGGTPNIDSPNCDTAGLGGIPGPGGFAGGDGAGNGGTGTEDGAPGQGPGMSPAQGGVASTVTESLFAGAGGGGGGHLVAGSPGSADPATGAQAGAGGEAHMSVPPLIGGGGGGGGSVEKDASIGEGTLSSLDDDGAGGGGGGGAIAIDSAVAIVVTGTINVSGGAGGNNDGAGCADQGLGGGGAGGAIHLLSPSTDIGGATLDVSGGLGGVTDSADPAAVVLNGGDGSEGRIVAPPTGYGMCTPGGGPTECIMGEGCLTDDVDTPTFGICVTIGCAVDADCPAAPGSGTAAALCVDITGDGVAEECVLDCSAGETCPAGMDCFNDNICVHTLE